MCQKNRHNYVSFDIDTNCVEIFIEKKEGGTDILSRELNTDKRILVIKNRNLSENRFRTSVKKVN